MRQDKSNLRYHGKSQCEHCFELLSSHCEKVFLSNRRDQALWPEHRKFPQIHDTFLDMGPLGGILSAMTAYPKVAWLVLACDLPYVDEKTIATLIQGRDPSKVATAYLSVEDGLPEPLCAIYEPKSRLRLLEFLDLGCRSPCEILANSDIQLLKQKSRVPLININYPDEYHRVVKFLNAKSSLPKRQKTARKS